MHRLSIKSKTNSVGYFNAAINSGVYSLHVDSSGASSEAFRNNRVKAAIGTGWVLHNHYRDTALWSIGASASWQEAPLGSHMFELIGAVAAIKTVASKLVGVNGRKPLLFVYMDNRQTSLTISDYCLGNTLSPHVQKTMGAYLKELDPILESIDILSEWERGHEKTNSENNIADKLSYSIRRELEVYTSLRPLQMQSLVERIMSNNLKGKFNNYAERFLHNSQAQMFANIENAVVISTHIGNTTDGSHRNHMWSISTKGVTHRQKNYLASNTKVQGKMDALVHMMDVYRNSEHYDKRKTIYLSGASIAGMNQLYFAFINGRNLRDVEDVSGHLTKILAENLVVMLDSKARIAPTKSNRISGEIKK